jgi:hypothetical protein
MRFTAALGYNKEQTKLILFNHMDRDIARKFNYYRDLSLTELRLQFDILFEAINANGVKQSI